MSQINQQESCIMVSTSISARPIPKVDWSGSLRWTDWRLCDQKQWSQGTRSRKMMTTRASSTKPGDIFEISIASMLKRRPPVSSMTRCWKYIQIAPTQDRYGEGQIKQKNWLRQRNSLCAGVAWWHGIVDRRCWSGIPLRDDRHRGPVCMPLRTLIGPDRIIGSMRRSDPENSAGEVLECRVIVNM